MPIFSSIGAAIDRVFTKANPANKAIITLGLNGPVWTPANYANFAREGYESNADVFACINILTGAFRGLKWLTYSKRGKKVTEIEEGPLVDLMARPNPKQGTGAFFESLVGFYMIAGNTYVCRTLDNKPPTELYTMRPDRMTIVKGTAQEPVKGYEYRAGGQIIPIDPDHKGQKILHLRTFNPLDDWYGLSPIQAAARNVDMSNEIQKWNVALLQNNMRPPGALVVQESLDDENRNRMVAQLKERHQGALNAGVPMLLDGGNFDWKQMSFSPAESDWLAGDERASRKITSAFGVPPEMLGIMAKGGLNDSNFQQARKRLYMETVLPLADGIRDELNLWLCPLFGDGLFIDYDRDDIEAIQEDRATVWDRALKSITGGMLTQNEAREMVGFEALPGGDVLLVPSTVVPSGQKPPKPAPVTPIKAADPLIALDRISSKAKRVAGLLA